MSRTSCSLRAMSASRPLNSCSIRSWAAFADADCCRIRSTCMTPILYSSACAGSATSSNAALSVSALDISFIGYSMRDMAGGHVLRRRFDMPSLIIEEYIRAERAQELALVEPAEKQRLVDADVPCAKRTDHPFVRRRAARRDERRADRARILRKIGLDPMQRGKEFLERSARQRLRGRI